MSGVLRQRTAAEAAAAPRSAPGAVRRLCALLLARLRCRRASRRERCACSRSGCSTNSAGASVSSTEATTGAAGRAGAQLSLPASTAAPERVEGVAEGTLIFSGASLLSLAREDLRDARSLADARRLLRAALDQCLDGRPLRTREVMLAMRAHGAGRGG